MSIRENIIKIKNSIPENVTLVAVSKTKPVELILEAYNAGQRDFGENYVQELIEKEKQLPKDIHWHFIGHLQSNKVKSIISFVHLIHGVDSLKLLQEINKQALKVNRIVNCLLQIHIAREETKFGFDFAECDQLINSPELSQLKNIRVCGFMAMASNTDDVSVIRNEFKLLKQFQLKLLAVNPKLTTLSFGMSNDYQIAIEVGSNMIRVGSLIFGDRNYTK